jgi:peroxiredoxin Q/BCP
MLAPGDTAPEFELCDHDGRTVSLNQLLADGPLVLFFYPADFTLICTREVCLFRDRYAELAAAGVAVAGISPNDRDSHARFRAQHALSYPLLADPDKTVIRAFGLVGPLGIGVRRASFVIGQDRVIRAAVRADLRLKPHERLIRQALTKEVAKKGSDPFSPGKGV